MTSPIWGALILGFFILVVASAFGKDLDDAKDEWHKEKEKEDDKH